MAERAQKLFLTSFSDQEADDSHSFTFEWSSKNLAPLPFTRLTSRENMSRSPMYELYGARLEMALAM